MVGICVNQDKIQFQGDEVTLLDYWLVIKKRGEVIIAFIVFVTFAATIISFLMPKYYKAEAVVMPVGDDGGGVLGSLMGQFGGLAGLAGVDAPSQRFIALLTSRTLVEDVIGKYNLMPVLFENIDLKSQILDSSRLLPTSNQSNEKKPTMEDAVNKLKGVVKFTDDKKAGVIKVSAEFKDPKIAAEVANGYVERLQNMINETSLTSAKRNRIFIEEQLAENKRELLNAGKSLNEFYKGGKVSSVESSVDVVVNELKGKRSKVKGEKIIGDDEHVTSDGFDPNLSDSSVLADKQKELEELQKQKEDIENKTMVEDVPQQVYLQYLTLRRNLLAQINTLLTQQYEMAKIEEAKSDLAFQVIDPARVPEKRSRPKRKQMVMMAFASSLFLGIFAAFFMEYIERVKVKAQS